MGRLMQENDSLKFELQEKEGNKVFKNIFSFI